MILAAVALIALASLFALAVVIRDVGREFASLEPKRGDAEDAERDAKDNQKAMAERKLAAELERRRDGK